jgi:hypothetical protein
MTTLVYNEKPQILLEKPGFTKVWEIKKPPHNWSGFFDLAGPVRFELTMGFPTPVFKTGAFNRSATDPNSI